MQMEIFTSESGRAISHTGIFLKTTKFLSCLINTPSQLAPLKSTAAEKQRKYEEKSAIQRQLEDLLAPTPAGQDPKLAVLAKQVTWVAVIVLVLIEIFVSVKTGGMPFSKEAVRF